MKKVLKVVMILLIFVIVICMGILARKAIIITKLTDLSEKTIESYKDNYYVIAHSQSTDFDSFIKSEKIIKDGEQIDIETSYVKDNGDKIKYSKYNLKDEKISLIERADYKMRYSKNTYTIDDLNVYKGSLKDVFKTSMKKAVLKNIDVYIISVDGFEYYVDAKTGLILKSIDLLNNISYDYEYELGKVTSKDMVLPDLSEYELKEE